MSDDQTIKDIENLARDVVKDAMQPNIKLENKVEALKTLAPIYTALRRHHEKEDEPEDDNNFNGFRTQINEAAHNGTSTEVRGRRGRNS